MKAAKALVRLNICEGWSGLLIDPHATEQVFCWQSSHIKNDFLTFFFFLLSDFKLPIDLANQKMDLNVINVLQFPIKWSARKSVICQIWLVISSFYALWSAHKPFSLPLITVEQLTVQKLLEIGSRCACTPGYLYGKQMLWVQIIWFHVFLSPILKGNIF